MAKAIHWNGSDGEGRKLGERLGLDIEKFQELFNLVKNGIFQLSTPVVLAVNDAHLVLHILCGYAVP